MIGLRFMLVTVTVLTAVLALSSAIAQEQAKATSKADPVDTPSVAAPKTEAYPSSLPAAQPEVRNERELRQEGEKRFRTNCGRCHMAPHKFPPQVMATAIRHMRVRAMITDEDMRLILRYMTQ